MCLPCLQTLGVFAWRATVCCKHRLACKNICWRVIHCEATGEAGRGECLFRKQLVEARKGVWWKGLCVYHLDENKVYHTGFQTMGLLQPQSKSLRSFYWFLYVFSQTHCVLAFNTYQYVYIHTYIHTYQYVYICSQTYKPLTLWHKTGKSLKDFKIVCPMFRVWKRKINFSCA